MNSIEVEPHFWSDRRIVEISPGARLTYIGLWNFADKDGCHDNSPRLIKARIWPGDENVTLDMVEQWLGELSSRGLIDLVNGENYFEIADFSLEGSA